MHGKRPPKSTNLGDYLFGSDAKQPRNADIYALGCVRTASDAIAGAELHIAIAGSRRSWS